MVLIKKGLSIDKKGLLGDLQSMLPFLKNKRAPGIAISYRKPDDTSSESETKEDDSTDSIKICAQDLIKAINENNISGVAEALRSAFQILDSEPHEEGPHTYEAQNAKAAEEQE